MGVTTGPGGGNTSCTNANSSCFRSRCFCTRSFVDIAGRLSVAGDADCFAQNLHTLSRVAARPFSFCKPASTISLSIILTLYLLNSINITPA